MLPLRQIEVLPLPEPKQLFFTHFVTDHHFCYSFYNFVLSVNFCLWMFAVSSPSIKACQIALFCFNVMRPHFDLGYMLFNTNKTGYVYAAVVPDKN
jgi:hypothetical protein